MKILLAGDFLYYMYQEAVAQAMEELGHVVVRFKIKDFFPNRLSKIEQWASFYGIYSQNMNKAIINVAKKEKPDVILIWRATLILPQTVDILKKYAMILVSYNNDDPFSPQYLTGNFHQKRVWRYFIPTISKYDINLIYRPINKSEYKQFGSKVEILFPPYFIPKEIGPIQKSEKVLEVVFAGYYEPFRFEQLKFLLQNGINLKIYGHSWNNQNWGGLYEEPIELLEKNYFDTIKKSKIALAFLSKLNRDVYTRRCFEIPATGTFLLCERTDEMQNFYEEGKEAEYFSSKEELLDKVKYYLWNDNQREKIAQQGYIKSYEAGYDIKSSVKKIIEQLI